MSCLNLGKRLLPKKAWKVFTSKLQSKLHKLHRSKAIKKPKKRLNTSSKTALWPLQPVSQPKRRTVHPTHTLGHHRRRRRRQKRSSPVFIDELFIERVSVTTAEPPGKGANPKKNKLPDHEPADFVGTSKEETEGGDEKMCEAAADDMWESLALASPQMQGINERAEEFITRFRAEMQLQEKFAGRL
uniref:Uncharacterized protein n=1 Tax=Davidia involucrata TaxID=16924 RepID=A0A5B6ZIM7_DAVIN